jgi:hypothetical protein
MSTYTSIYVLLLQARVIKTLLKLDNDQAWATCVYI